MRLYACPGDEVEADEKIEISGMNREKTKNQVNSSPGSMADLKPDEQIRLLSSALASLRDAVYITDLDHNIIYANDAVRFIQGYSPADIVGKKADKIFEGIPGNPSDLAETIAREAENGFWIGEVFNRKNDGTIFPVQLIENTIYGKDGGVVGYIGVSRDISDRKAAVEALAESEEKYRILTESSLTGIFIVSAEGKALYVNDTFCRLSGYREKEMLGKNIFELVHPEDRPRLQGFLKKRLAGQEVPERYLCRALRRNGEVRWAEIRACRINYRGRPAALGNFLDVTETRKAEERLRWEKEKARMYLDVAGVIIIVIGRDQKIRMINKKGCEITGYREDELIGKNYYDLLFPEGVKQEAKAAFQKLIERDIDLVPNGETEIVTRGGEKRTILWRNSAVFDKTGQVLATVNSGEDITDRKATEEALIRSETRNKMLLAAIPDLMFILSREGDYIDCRANNNHSLAMPRREVIGKNIADIGFTAQDLQAIKNHIARAFATRQVQTFEYNLETPGGGSNWEARIVALNDEEVLCIVRDITERKKTEARLRETSKLEAVGTMSLGIAHEFNNILMGIGGYAQLAREDLKNQEMVEKACKTITRLVGRSKNLIKRLSTFGKREKPHPAPINLTIVIGEALALQRRQLELANITIRKNFEKPSLVMADFSQIEQVFLNLIMNARQAMIAQGEGMLKITVRDKAEMVETRISDTGAGISSEELPRIFQPFFTTKWKEKDDQVPSLGLGLWISRKIVEEHGGTIKAESSPGQGTTFIINLPAVPRIVQAGGEDKKISTGDLRLEGKSILLIDDEADLLDILGQYLEGKGMKVFRAASGREALHQCEQTAFDAIIMDYVMPGLSGKKLALQIHEISSPECFFVISGKPVPPGDWEILEPFLRGWLEKPLELDQLAADLSEGLNRP